MLVTERVVPLRVGGRIVHQIGLPYHWGVGGDAVVTGDSANDLFGVTLDPNVHIQESKVGVVRHPARAGARAGRPCCEYVEAYRRRAGITVDTGNELRNPASGPNGGARRMASGKEQHDRRSEAPEPASRSARPTRRAGRDAGWDGAAARARGSSPTPRSASAARPARWPARSGTASPRTATTCSAAPTTTPAQLERQHLAPRRLHRAAASRRQPPVDLRHARASSCPAHATRRRTSGPSSAG